MYRLERLYHLKQARPASTAATISAATNRPLADSIVAESEDKVNCGRSFP
ncbi:MAG: hypothetical protein JW913_19970 [Chitinispirillaceae bacterium]|nr:hypothetical protein [Chitinispirillaceae bacterium]